MHETAIAQNLHKLISGESAKYGQRPVAAKISCGAFSAVNDELLKEAFDAVIKGTNIEGLNLEIEHKPMQGLCNKCKQKFKLDLSSMKCAACGSEDFDLLSDAPLVLEEIEFKTEKKSESQNRQKNLKRK